ncbi:MULTISPECIES: rod-binding protein [unclassified Massilia]|uniref:rod-binding protein n=1 Tax=unclassified Massilia TaxID=2609279 RepID=UPI00177FBEFE|nr:MULTISPECIES: rod-binding protein [unclassified Massilia]MBD8529003.1 rod-binding protein [Massilia sp. CFBP 13647]MBD8672397.1 rod-binding protein [Massilia sp. CFBP 13721]
MDRTTPLNPLLPRAGVVKPDAVTPAAENEAHVAQATKAAVEFESFFISQMLKDMRSTTREMADEDSVFKDKVNRDMQDMADGILSKQMAGQRAFGVADAILRQLLPAKNTPGST